MAKTVKETQTKVKDLSTGVTQDGTFKQQNETVVKEAFGVVVETNY